MSARLSVAFACCAGACLAWAVGALAAPDEPRGKFSGKTAQKRRIVLRASPGHLDLLHFTVSLQCRDGSLLIDQESGFQPTPIRAGGSFRDDQVGSTDEVRLRGQVRGSQVRGRLRVTDRVGRVRCDSRWVKFTARR